jgi:hypothetical protein
MLRTRERSRPKSHGEAVTDPETLRLDVCAECFQKLLEVRPCVRQSRLLWRFGLTLKGCQTCERLGRLLLATSLRVVAQGRAASAVDKGHG